MTKDGFTVFTTNPFTGTRDFPIKVKGNVTKSGSYTTAIHQHVIKLISRLDMAATIIWEFEVTKLMPRIMVCEHCSQRVGKVKDLVIVMRVQKGLEGGGWSIAIDELEWIPVGTWIDKEHPEDMWISLKKVIQ